MPIKLLRRQRARGHVKVRVYFVGQAIAQAAWKMPYSLLDNPISDLGNTACDQWPPASAGSQLAQRLGAGNGYVCSPLHSVMDISEGRDPEDAAQ